MYLHQVEFLICYSKLFGRGVMKRKKNCNKINIFGDYFFFFLHSTSR